MGDGGSTGFADDAEDVQATDITGLLQVGGLALGGVEVSGNSNDGVGDDTTKTRPGGPPHFSQDHGGDFFG